MNALNIFRAGTHTDLHGRALTFTAADLAATAAAYDPARHEAPLVIGHPALDDPAYGWVEALAVAADRLEATPRQVDPEFAALVNAERFNRISASFFLPDAPSNPAPGTYYLRHVGFLGAAAPAVPGLRKPSFALADADAGVCTLEFALTPESSPVSEAPPAAPAAPAAPAPAPTVDYAAQIADLEAENARIKTELTAERQRQARAEAVAYAAAQAESGKILPRQQPGLVELLLTLPDAPLSFADPAGQTVQIGPRAWLEQFLSDLPAQVDYAERSAPTPSKTPSPSAVAARATQLHRDRAAAGTPISFTEAVDLVRSGDVQP